MPEPDVGHGPTPWHCSCHLRHHPVPSLAAECERTTEKEGLPR
ncbi:hypothetical protein ACH473_10595 [Cellulosimicrobium funkei]